LFAWTARLLDPRAPAETTTDAEGGFAWEHLRPGTWDLAVSTRGYAEETVSGIELEEGRVHDLGLLRLTPGTPLAGRVQDADGAPLEGAQVRLTVPSTFAASFADEPAPDAVSDPDGWFSIPDRRAGERLDLEVRRDGFVRRDLPGVVVEDHPLVVALEPAAGLTGVVVGDDGAPVSRAFVTAHGEGGTAGPGGRVWADLPVANTVTDEEGLFELADLPAGHLRLLVRAEGYRLEERTGIEVETGAKEQALTIRLRRGALVQGRVAASDGSPVSGASVSVVEETGGRWMSGATTDGDGRYRLDGVEPGRRTVGAVAEDGRSTRRELEVIDGANTLDLAFEPGWPVAGTVLDAAGAPVADAFLTLAAESTAWAGIEARTDEHGAFRFEDVREGTYWLRARHRRYAMTRLEDPVEVAGPVADVELRLASGARIVGTLSGLEEVELRQSEVIAYDRRTGTAAGRIAPDGGFVIPALAPGDWTVLASAPGGRRATDHVAIAPGEEEIRVDLSFGDGFTLEGTVLLESEPLSGAQVALRNQDIADSAWSRTDHLGRFQADGLEPGRYSLVVSKFDSGLHHQEELLLLDDEEVLIEIERRRVSGRVVDAVDEAPVAGAAVRLQPHDVDPALFPTSTRGPGTRSDSSGAFSLGSVTAGLHELSVSKDGYGRLEQALEVVGDVEGLVLRLEPTEGLALRVRLPDGSPARQVSVVALDPWSGQPLDGGRFLATSDGDVRLASLPPGRWILLVGAADAAVAEVTLTAPGEGESVQLGLGTRLEIVVPSLTGPVVPAATVALERPTGEPFRHPGSGELRLRWPLWNGRSAVENLPAGPWIIHVEATDGRRWDETISVEAGGTQKVELD
jgi:protocatechuate 3,4-dioxygenase beta subunit